MTATPGAPAARQPALRGARGELVLVSIAVEPRRLELLLDTLAELPFPLNPEIYHNAEVTRVYADGRQESEPAVMVDFPAWECNLAAVGEALRARGFPPGCYSARNLLEGLESDVEQIPAPAGAPYAMLIRRKWMASAA